MAEDFSHQNDSFDDQTQLEAHLSPQETLDLPAKTDISLEETEILPTVVQMPLAAPQILPHQPRRRSPFIKALVIALLVLIVLLTGTSVYAMKQPHIFSSSNSSSASILITLDSQQLSKTSTTHITVGSTDPTLNPIGAHRISITTLTQYLTVPSTGKKQEPATRASGLLQLIGGSENNPIPVNTYDIISYSGIDIEFAVSSPLYKPAYVSAHAIHPGPTGNIRVYDVNGLYNFADAYTDFVIVNRQPFSGGQNAHTITVVSQTDINSAISQLTTRLNSALSADQTELKSKLAPSERLLDPTKIQCQSSVEVNRNPDDQASDVTATGSMTCSAIAYTPARLVVYAANLLQNAASAQWSGSYILVGQAQERLYNVLDQGKTASFSLDVQGHYAFQLSPGLQAHFASLVADQTQANAQALLLRQAGVVQVSIQVSGGSGMALPSSPKDIHITIQ
ncbi:MAG TPA: hypothetical protein VGM01_07945 [Ktedonobacteraceae bacterium]